MNENMQKYLDKAQVLIEALPYIQRFNRKIIVVKYGGSSMVATFMLIGILQAVSEASGREAEAHLEEEGGEEDA